VGSDRARVSYDRSRQWRGVVNQQGRVTLEADWNEAATIAAEQIREDLVDVIGPAGTPDDGYGVTPVVNADGNPTGDLNIGHGTMYVGGERMVLDSDLLYLQQPDWVDRVGDPLWIDADVPEGEEDEAVFLLLREQEVGAVEDPALLDVALGGPDTSERLRIVQRVVRARTDGSTCADALSTLEDRFGNLGLVFHGDTMRLESSATLKVSFEQDPKAGTPCEPVAQGGYLGAENQLIRVQVASVDQSGRPTLVWGFDNAYFLYRVTVVNTDTGAGTTTLKLSAAPVDSYHQPAKGQAVEVLESAAKLTDEDYIAATTGIVTAVNTAYKPETQEVVISAALTSPTTDSPVIFLRAWQDTIASYAGGPVALGTTGVQVTVDSGRNDGKWHVGDFWTFAVRPGTPTQISPVYPERYLEAPQPPEGPRLWMCPLAVVDWADGTPKVTDCRNHFDDLVTLTERGEGCCIDVSPDTAKGGAGLQAIIDRYARQGPVTICLRAGTYTVPEPLVVATEYRGLTIKGCGKGVVIRAAKGPPHSFLLGLIRLESVEDFELRDITLELPLAAYSVAAGTITKAVAGLPSWSGSLVKSLMRGLHVSIGVYAIGGSGVTIDGCDFEFPQTAGNVFGAGVFATRRVEQLELAENRFAAPEAETFAIDVLGLIGTRAEAQGPLQVRFGYLQVPSPAARARPLLQRLAAAPNETKAEAATATTLFAMPSLADASIERNLFDGLGIPVLFAGQGGTIRIEDNTVRACYGGFWLVGTVTTTALTFVERVGSADAKQFSTLSGYGLTWMTDPVLTLGLALGRLLPITPDQQDPVYGLTAIEAPSKTLLGRAETLLNKTLKLVTPIPLQAAAAPVVAADEKPVEVASELKDLFKAPTAKATGTAPRADVGTELEPRWVVTGNEVDAVIAESYSGAGLVAASVDSSHPGSLLCDGNRFRSRTLSGATTALWSLLEVTVTGNIVTNEAGGQTDLSLVLAPLLTAKKRAAVAVTGNVCIGTVSLPPRGLPPPFADWNGLNTLL
jgi:hypothetical protein